jgi:hypothetical protein
MTSAGPLRADEAFGFIEAERGRCYAASIRERSDREAILLHRSLAYLDFK